MILPPSPYYYSYSGSRTVFVISDPVESSTQELDRNTHSLAMRYQNTSSGSLSRMNSRSHASMNGSVSPVFRGILSPFRPRSISENVSVSRELSQSSIPASLVGSARVPPDYTTRPPPQYQPPKSNTLPATFDTSHIQVRSSSVTRPSDLIRPPLTRYIYQSPCNILLLEEKSCYVRWGGMEEFVQSGDSVVQSNGPLVATRPPSRPILTPSPRRKCTRSTRRTRTSGM